MSKAFDDILKDHEDNPYLSAALTHSSLSDVNYERLEFLGDRVLGLAIADLLYKEFPEEVEGDLAKRHTALVNGETLANKARAIGLDKHIQMSDAEKTAGGSENDNILCDAFESVLGAIYLHSGYAAGKEFVRDVLGDDLFDMKEPPQDPKTALQEWTQARGLGLPIYEVINHDGPDHAPVFTIEVSIDGYGSAKSEGTSKRVAQKQAAEKLLEKLQDK